MSKENLVNKHVTVLYWQRVKRKDTEKVKEVEWLQMSLISLTGCQEQKKKYIYIYSETRRVKTKQRRDFGKHNSKIRNLV